jgi:hypothetical protein
MSEEQRREDLLGTTDCLEAIGVFKAWKNGLFVLAVTCLVLLQICFWIVDADVIKPSGGDSNAPTEKAVPVQAAPLAAVTPLASKIQIEVPDDVIAKAAAQSVNEVKGSAAEEPAVAATPPPAEPNAAQKPAVAPKKDLAKTLHIEFKHIVWLIRVCNYILVFTITLYCLCLLFCLKISLLARLGGINHISRAFMLSLLVFVLVLPWQKFFGGVVTGLIYTPNELITARADVQGAKIITIALYYLRFCGFWAVVVAALVFSQARSSRWAKATLRRLGVV